MRQAVTDILTQESFDVITAVDGAVGTILYQERMTDVQLVLLDLSMPGMSSEETLNELRRINPEVRVILSSGYTESDAIGSFKVKKLDRFLQKPYSAEELVSIVRQHLIRT